MGAGATATGTVQTTTADVVRCVDGVVEVRYRERAVVGLTEIEEVLAAVAELSESRVAVLVDARPVKSMTREAQGRTTDHPVNARTAAVAILVDNPVSVLLGNFFLRLSRPPYPSRLFRAEAKARDWLRTMLEHKAP